MNKIIKVVSIYPFCISELYHDELFDLYINASNFDPEIKIKEIVNNFLLSDSEVNKREVSSYMFVPFDINFRKAMTEACIPFVTVMPKCKDIKNIDTFIGAAYRHYIKAIPKDDTILEHAFLKEFTDWARTVENRAFELLEKHLYIGAGSVTFKPGNLIESSDTIYDPSNIFPIIQKKLDAYYDRCERRSKLIERLNKAQAL